MDRTLCFTGMDRAEGDQLAAAFEDANRRIGGAWRLVPEAEAATLVIDVDSIYGHMTWLRAQHGAQRVVSLTANPRGGHGTTLHRPVSASSLEALLRELDGEEAPAAPAPPAAPMITPTGGGRGAGADAEPTVPAFARAATPEPTPPPPPPPAAIDAPRPATPAPAPAREDAAAEPPAPEAAQAAEASDAPRVATLLVEGLLAGPSRLRRPGLPDLLLDPATRSWRGDGTLKPWLGWGHEEVRAEDAEPVDAAALEAAGKPQPYARLLWLCALAEGRGQLIGLPADARVQLLKWPQVEREFPRHFRIATAMMKGPATVAEIAALSSVEPGEVADYVNASLAVGHAEPWVDASAGQAPPRGLFNRLRGLRGP